MADPSPEIHTPITQDEIAKTFDDVAVSEDLSDFGVEDWLTLGLFWVMCLCVFLQFFTRYVLNDSYAWTEEVAIYCLVLVVFLGSAMCVRRAKHIHVDFLYRSLPASAGRVLSTIVDIIRTAFFAYMSVLVWRYAAIIHDETMTTINLPKFPFFMMIFAAFVLMTLRSIQVAIANWRRGYSVLERPEAFDGTKDTPS